MAAVGAAEVHSKKKKNKLRKLDWDQEVMPYVKEIIETRKYHGISRLTLRDLFYILVSKGILENLYERYKGLSIKLVEARKKEEIDPDFIVDESRSIIDIDYHFYLPEQIIDAKFDFLESLPYHLRFGEVTNSKGSIL